MLPSEPLFHPGMKFIPLRIWWILFSMLIAPTILHIAGVPDVWALFVVEILALPACFAPLRQLGIKKVSPLDIFLVILITSGILILSGTVSVCWRMCLSKLGFNFPEKQMIAEIISKTNSYELILLFVAICIITPIVEEVLFRRLIYDFLKQWGEIIGFAGTSLLFAIIHFFIPGLPGLFILGCGFQIIFLFRKNLTCSILSHALVNSVAFAVNFHAN